MNKQKCRKQVFITYETDDMLKKCKQEFLKLHPEFEQIPISYNKIIYETARIYLEV